MSTPRCITRYIMYAALASAHLFEDAAGKVLRSKKKYHVEKLPEPDRTWYLDMFFPQRDRDIDQYFIGRSKQEKREAVALSMLIII